VPRSSHLASLVPVIVNAILNEHQIIVDIVAFVNKGKFPRSRLGEKQRGNILAKWVKRTLPTEAQFAIRNLDPNALADLAGEVDPRASIGSMRSGQIAGPSSLRNQELAPQILEQEEGDYMHPNNRPLPPDSTQVGGQGQMSHRPVSSASPGGGGARRMSGQNDATSYSLAAKPMSPGAGSQTGKMPPQSPERGGFDILDFDRFGEDMPPAVPPKPTTRPNDGHPPPQIRLPGVDGRESFDLWTTSGDRDQDDDAWKTDAIMHMNLAGDMSRRS
jgi:hypothetical protein